jgi:CRP/FNR family transcriptional regulator, cyclic AMP receptor protein
MDTDKGRYKEDFLKRVPLFSALTTEELTDLMRVFQERVYRKNQIVFLEEDTGEYMYLVKSGKVKVSKATPEGKENILAIHNSGEFFGEMSLLDGKTSPATVTAMEPCRLLIVSKQDFQTVLLRNEKISSRLMAILCSRLREAWSHIQTLSFASAETRILSTLNRLAQSSGVRDRRGVIINVKITHLELAEMSGTSRETATRIIIKLQEEGQLDIVDHKFVLLDQPQP